MSYSKKIKTITHSVFNDKAQLLVIGMIIVYFAFFTFYMLSKHYSFTTYWLDLGIYDHNLWNILNFGDPSFPFGAIHQSQLMYFLLPAYAIFPHAETLLVIQSLVVPLGALPLYRLAKMELRMTSVALALAGLYLLYPALHGVSSYDFHLEAFLPTLFLSAMYFYRAERWKSFTLSIIFLLFTMRYASYLTVAFGLFLLAGLIRGISLRSRTIKLDLFYSKKTKFAIMTIVLSLVALAIHNSLTLEILVPIFTSFTGDGPSLTDRLNYVTQLYGPVAFISFLNPAHLLLTAPWFAFVAVTPDPEHLGLYNQYPAFVIPFIFIGAVAGIKRLSNRNKKISVKITLLLFVATSFYFASTDPVFATPFEPITPSWPEVTSRDTFLSRVGDTIPKEASVLTQNSIAPHISDRRGKIYITLDDTQTVEPDYILVDKSHPSYREINFRPNPSELLPKFIDSGKYHLVIDCDDIILYKKGPLSSQFSSLTDCRF